MAKKRGQGEDSTRRERKRGQGEGSIRKRKDGTREARLTIGVDPETGTQKQISKYFKTREEARDWLAKAVHERATGVFVEPNKITLGEWLDRWLNTYKKPARRRTTYDNYETMVRVHIKPAIGHIPLLKLRASDLQELYNRKKEEGKSSSLIRRLSLIIGAALDQAVKEQLIYRNPNGATELPPLKYKEATPLSVEEVYRFLEAAETDRLYAAYFLDLATGLRRGELLALRWQDVDLENGKVFVNRTVSRVTSDSGPAKTKLEYQEPKTDKSKASVPMPETALKELRAHRKRQNEERLFFGTRYHSNDLVFCTEDGRQLDPKNFFRRYKRLLQKAGVPDVSFHTLRHTFATLLLEAGEEMKTVQEILRHAKLSTTADIYTKVSEKLKKRASAKINDILSQRKRQPG
jgi:integrase